MTKMSLGIQRKLIHIRIHTSVSIILEAKIYYLLSFIIIYFNYTLKNMTLIQVFKYSLQSLTF